MTSEHLEDLPLPRGRGFSGPRAKIQFDSNQSQAFSVDSIITSSKASIRGILPRKNVKLLSVKPIVEVAVMNYDYLIKYFRKDNPIR
jgi:hypothetical protein|tara:strand:- start:797 stop:1057 length:261 start_codon:yes stop_codon:yes gene_type:complete